MKRMEKKEGGGMVGGRIAVSIGMINYAQYRTVRYG